ncbi:MAG: hypothetical protein GXP40_05575 [Chloroflexi bacterium]|nr:hypothetical protein [Chloroflexota bacterium]
MKSFSHPSRITILHILSSFIPALLLAAAVVCLAVGVYLFALCPSTLWSIWLGLAVLLAALAVRRRELLLALIPVLFLALSLSGRAAATECWERWDCADNECCHGGVCLPKSDPRCGVDDTPTPAPPTISGTLACSQWGTGGWCVGSETLDLTASDPQGQDLMISGDVDGAPFACPPGAGSVSCSRCPCRKAAVRPVTPSLPRPDPIRVRPIGCATAPRRRSTGR